MSPEFEYAIQNANRFIPCRMLGESDEEFRARLIAIKESVSIVLKGDIK